MTSIISAWTVVGNFDTPNEGEISGFQITIQSYRPKKKAEWKEKTCNICQKINVSVISVSIF